MKHVAGNGNSSDPSGNGDGGPAIAATIPSPRSVAVSRDGSLLVASNSVSASGGRRVRRVDTSGTIATVVGTGVVETDFFGLDGQPAAGAGINEPRGITEGPDGDLYISEAGRRVLRISPPLPGFDVADILVPEQDGSSIFQF